MMEGQVFVARGRLTFKRTVITNLKVLEAIFFFCVTQMEENDGNKMHSFYRDCSVIIGF